jgi:type IV pilus modification protein PilV
MRTRLKTPPSYTSKRGYRAFTMMEMLVAIVIFVIALLALGVMQLRGMSYTRDANMRTQAIYAARNLADAIRSNIGANYTYNGSGGLSATADDGCGLVLGSTAFGPCPCNRRDADIGRTFDEMEILPPPEVGDRLIIRPIPFSPGVVGTDNTSALSCPARFGVAYEITVRWREGGVWNEGQNLGETGELVNLEADQQVQVIVGM